MPKYEVHTMRKVICVYEIEAASAAEAAQIWRDADYSMAPDVQELDEEILLGNYPSEAMREDAGSARR